MPGTKRSYVATSPTACGGQRLSVRSRSCSRGARRGSRTMVRRLVLVAQRLCPCARWGSGCPRAARPVAFKPQPVPPAVALPTSLSSLWQERARARPARPVDVPRRLARAPRVPQHAWSSSPDGSTVVLSDPTLWFAPLRRRALGAARDLRLTGRGRCDRVDRPTFVAVVTMRETNSSSRRPGPPVLSSRSYGEVREAVRGCDTASVLAHPWRGICRQTSVSSARTGRTAAGRIEIARSVRPPPLCSYTLRSCLAVDPASCVSSSFVARSAAAERPRDPGGSLHTLRPPVSILVGSEIGFAPPGARLRGRATSFVALLAPDPRRLFDAATLDRGHEILTTQTPAVLVS